MVRTSVPGRPGQRFSTVTIWPSAFSSTISVVEVPTSSRWNVCCRPDTPTVVPGRNGTPSSCSTLAVSVSTSPDTAEAMLLNSRDRPGLMTRPGVRLSPGRSAWYSAGLSRSSSTNWADGASVIQLNISFAASPVARARRFAVSARSVSRLGTTPIV